MSESVKDLNFSDGDIILAIGKHKCRVHKTFLSSKSSVFADMFSMPPPADELEQTNKTADEIPVVVMHDKPEEFALFLHALYGHQLEEYIPRLRRTTLPLISGVLDLADKYDIPQREMHDMFVPILERDWPSTLAEWDANEDRIRQLAEEQQELETLDDLLPEPASVIRFARDSRASNELVRPTPKYLRVAFYHLARLPPFADPDDVTLNGDHLGEGGRTANRSLLYRQDHICLAQGIYELREAAARLAFDDFPRRAGEFPGASQTEKEAMMSWWRAVGVERLLGCNRWDLIHEMKVLIVALDNEKESDCPGVGDLYRNTSQSYRDALREFLQKEREGHWESLSHYFSLYEFFYPRN